MAPGRSKIVEHYIMPEATEGNFRALCKHCNRAIACSRKALSNLHAHIKRVHPALFESMPRGKKSSPTQAPLLQSPGLLANAITENIVPLSLLESPSFKRFCQSLDPNLTVTSRKMISGSTNSPSCWTTAESLSPELVPSMFRQPSSASWRVFIEAKPMFPLSSTGPVVC